MTTKCEIEGRALTTAQATDYLGRVLEFGGSKAEADWLLSCAIAQARATNWARSKALLDAAYHALGAPADPSSGYAFYCGCHPIQVAAARLGREMDEREGPMRPPVANPGPAGAPGGPYDTPYRHFLATVAAGEAAGAGPEEMDAARRALAARADRLSRRRPCREEVAALRSRYDALAARMIAAGCL